MMKLRLLDISDKVLFRFVPKIYINQNYFKNIEDEHTAYWLGTVCAKHRFIDNGIRVYRKDADIPHMSKFFDVIQMTPNREYNLHVVSKRNSFATIRNSFFADCVNEAVMSSYQNIDPQIENHFWRGVLDANGSIFTSPHKRLEITGSLPLVTGFRDFCKRNINTNAEPRYQCRTYRFGVLRGQVDDVCSALYEKSTIHLPRLHERYREIVFGESKQVS